MSAAAIDFDGMLAQRAHAAACLEDEWYGNERLDGGFSDFVRARRRRVSAFAYLIKVDRRLAHNREVSVRLVPPLTTRGGENVEFDLKFIFHFDSTARDANRGNAKIALL